METYLENILQNKEINKIVIYLGSKVDNKIFKQNEISKEQFLNIFKSYQIKQSIVNFYQAGNKIKTDDKYFKMVQARNTKLQHRCTALTQAGKSLRLCTREGVALLPLTLI